MEALRMRTKMIMMMLMGVTVFTAGCPTTGGGGNGTDPCEGVTCAEGEMCVDGDCVAVDPCEGVMCDEGEMCVDGACVAADPCEGVMCDEGQECVDGECVAVDPCEGVMCDEGEMCVDGACVAADPCEGVMCDEGQECVDGECVAVDPCEGVMCDEGETCVDGVCMPSMGAGDAANGATVYANTCLVCHGEDGAGGAIGPDIQGTAAAQIEAAVSGDGGHTPYDVSDQDILDLEAYLGGF
jgi:hypothetical protein